MAQLFVLWFGFGDGFSQSQFQLANKSRNIVTVSSCALNENVHIQIRFLRSTLRDRKFTREAFCLWQTIIRAIITSTFWDIFKWTTALDRRWLPANGKPFHRITHGLLRGTEPPIEEILFCNRSQGDGEFRAFVSWLESKKETPLRRLRLVNKKNPKLKTWLY